MEVQALGKPRPSVSYRQIGQIQLPFTFFMIVEWKQDRQRKALENLAIVIGNSAH